MNCKNYKAYATVRRKFLELSNKNVKSEVVPCDKLCGKDTSSGNIKKTN